MNETSGTQLSSVTRSAVARVLAGEKVANATPLADYILGLKEADVNSEESCQALIDAAKICKLGHKEIDDQRKSITAPLKEATDAANGLAAPMLTKLKSAMDHAKKLYDSWSARKKKAEADRIAAAALVEAKAAEARAAAAQELTDAGAQDVDLPPEMSTFVPQPTTQVKGGLGAMHQSKKKAYRVTDLVAAVAANQHLFKIELRINDTKAAYERARQFNPDATLIGIEEYDDTSTSLT